MYDVIVVVHEDIVTRLEYEAMLVLPGPRRHYTHKKNIGVCFLLQEYRDSEVLVGV